MLDALVLACRQLGRFGLFVVHSLVVCQLRKMQGAAVEASTAVAMLENCKIVATTYNILLLQELSVPITEQVAFCAHHFCDFDLWRPAPAPAPLLPPLHLYFIRKFSQLHRMPLLVPTISHQPYLWIPLLPNVP
jgi:hypothetical protein